MPRIMNVNDAAACSLEEFADAIAADGFDPHDEGSLANAAQWLRRLGNNQSFLGDILLDHLTARHREEPAAQGYGPQSIVLTPAVAGAFLRANIWPGPGDALYEASGASSFLYGLPHDHNFSFLTHGYFGPGYNSDYYEYDYAGVAGWSGEVAHLRAMGRHRLEPGRIMLYRAHLDVHRQLPADSLSVSLNLMHADPAMHWRDQYSFDVEEGTVVRIIGDGPSEAFLRIAVALGTPEARDLAEDFAARHPSDRMRICAWDALAAPLDPSARDRLWARAETAGSRLVARTAQIRRAELELQST